MPPSPREPHGATQGLFIALIAAGLLGFAGCGPGSLIPPIIYLIQSLCRAAIIAAELPHCLTINISAPESLGHVSAAAAPTALPVP